MVKADKVMDYTISQLSPKLSLQGLNFLAHMIMNDGLPQFSSGVYVFAETIDNEISSFQAAEELVKKDVAAEVFIVHAGGRGTPGYAHWVDRLGNYISPGRIRPIELKAPYGPKESWVNTYSESEALVKFALKTNRDSFIIVAPPFHMIRAFMTAASASLSHGGKIKFYAYPGTFQDWDKYVTHSQGKGPYPRWKWLQIELTYIS